MQRFPDIAPSRSSVMRRRADVIEVRFGEGAVQRLPRFGGAPPHRDWQLVFTALDRAEINRIDSFLETHGGVTPFHWTPPQGRAGRYLCAGWQVTPLSTGLATLHATFTELPQT
jgi:phage-related protein